MAKREPKKPETAYKGLLGPTKSMQKEAEEMTITQPSRRVMEYMDMIRTKREELKADV